MQNRQLMKEYVLDLLKSKLSPFYYYHNPEHTLYVQERALEIGKYEGCTQEELDLLCIAALWHDTGLILVYKDHEEVSCLMATNYLSKQGYSDKDIDRIRGIIMATKLPQQPKNKLEEILADADLEYLGTPSFESTSDRLYQELLAFNPMLTKETWNGMQIEFLKKHKYFTSFCKEHRGKVKAEYLEKLIQSTKSVC